MQKVKSGWNAVRMRIEAERQSLAIPLSHAALESVDDGVLTIRVSKDYESEILREHQASIENALADVFGAPMRVHIVGQRKSRGPAAEVLANEPEPPVDLLQYASERIR
ncbi:MAG: hypothetical protein JOZ97_07470 [Candidatus Eremiobacteraeota bacterium]|nr:hypothetical protein [Candidatus Eremiobacteraeota bacterium]